MSARKARTTPSRYPAPARTPSADFHALLRGPLDERWRTLRVAGWQATAAQASESSVCDENLPLAARHRG